jgi:hypothetical protein
MSYISEKSIEVRCPRDECQHSWLLTIPRQYVSAEAILDEITGMSGHNENCPKCGTGVFIHYLKKNERPLRPPVKGHWQSPP